MWNDFFIKGYHQIEKLNSNESKENIHLFDEINYKLIYKNFLIIECKSLSYLNENPEKYCKTIESRIRIALTKWVNEEINLNTDYIYLKDCIVEYHALTGYENKRTIVKEK